MGSYDQWKTDPDYGHLYPDEEEEPSEEEYAYLDWCDEMLARQDDEIEPDSWFNVGPCVAHYDRGIVGFWSTCVLPSGADVALHQWLRF